jgi:hypothetical protein
VESVSVYNLRNKGLDPVDRETQMGIVWRDFTPKPAYFAFRDVLAELAAHPFPAPPVAQPSSRDRKRPVLSRLRASVQRGGRALRVTYRLSEPSRVSLRLARAARRPGCRRRCRRWIRFRGPSVHSARRGRNRVRLRLKGARPGRYRLSASARDRAGNRSKPRQALFQKRPS